MSPIHLKYLANMKVRSSMSISIVINSDLWGLIACHGYGDLGIRVTLPVRELCRNIGDCAATNIERLLMLQRIESRKPPTNTPPAQNPAGFIAASSADLLRVFGADFGLLNIQDEARAIGKLEPYREALAILAYLQAHPFMAVHECQNINKQFPDIQYPPGIHTLSGLLVIPLSATGHDFLVFFRRGELREVRWAGNPYEKINKPGTSYLEPRMSFKRWTETVVGTSKEWTEDQMETAAVLGLLYGRFIEIWRQKESAGQSNRMTRLLIQNAAHEVRTPLNAIVNYLEMALENKLDENTREILGKASTASKSLVYVINDLLSLTKIEHGVTTSRTESFNLAGIILDTLNSFKHEAVRKGLDLTVSTHQGLPEWVIGDAARLRQVLSNVTSNAFQHSIEGGIKVDVRSIRSKGNLSIISITIQDVGIGMSETQLDVSFSGRFHISTTNRSFLRIFFKNLSRSRTKTSHQIPLRQPMKLAHLVLDSQ
jgi:light-regulated signal transduction histidine kinase (bacteriophytochrome)